MKTALVPTSPRTPSRAAALVQTHRVQPRHADPAPAAFTVPTTHGWRVVRLGTEPRFDHLQTPSGTCIPFAALYNGPTLGIPKGVLRLAFDTRFDGSGPADTNAPLLSSVRLIGRNVPTVIPGAPVQLWTVTNNSANHSSGDLLAVVPVDEPSAWTTGETPRTESSASAAFGSGQVVVVDSPVGPLVGEFWLMPEGCRLLGRVIESFRRSGEECPWSPGGADASKHHTAPSRVFDGGEPTA